VGERAASEALESWRLVASQERQLRSEAADALSRRGLRAVLQAWRRRRQAAVEAPLCPQPPRLRSLGLMRRALTAWRRNARAAKGAARHLARAREVLAAVARETGAEGDAGDVPTAGGVCSFSR